MNSCVEPGCTGTYLDGWCDVCGSPEPLSAPSGPSTQEPAEAATGTGGGSGDQRSADGPDGQGDAGDPGHPEGPGADSGPAAATPAPGRSRQAVRAEAVRRRRARAGQRSRLGLGLTRVPDVPVIDPATKVLKDPQVPEHRRSCPNCGAEVGRAAGEHAGRQQGFCPQCRAPYSFTPKLGESDLVAGQYEVVGALAHGGMGWIYLARDRNVSGRWVVLKGLLNTGDEDALEAAVTEQQFLAQVKHPSIVEIYNVVQHDGDAYTVMEYVGGRSLKQLLQDRLEAAGRYDPFDVDVALAYVIEMLPALSHLHDLGLLYCDFKPDNVIHEGDGIKLIDLGGMRRADDLESPIYGTIGYQAPEVAEVGPSVASDIWTIGRTLAVLTFEFRGYQNEYVASLPPMTQVPAFREHDAFYRLVARCCAPDPNERFLTVDELRTQAVGVLRQVVAERDIEDEQDARVATNTTVSPFFEPPVSTTESLPWWELPRLRPDDTDPMLDWISSLPEEPTARHHALQQASEVTPEVLLARGWTGIVMGQRAWLTSAAEGLRREDPWDWRASWLQGLWSLSHAGDGSDEEATARAGREAAGHFGAVRDALPGEIAPRLALARASELAGYSRAAELDYRRALRTDAAYAAPAAFGLHRVRLGRDDRDGAIRALEAVPAGSRAHPRARWLRADLLRRRGGMGDLREAWSTAGSITLDPRQRAQFRISILESTLDRVRRDGEQPTWKIGDIPVTKDKLRRALEAEYLSLAAYTPDPQERAGLIDRAHAIRPWSWT